MKKIFSCILSFVMALCLTGCVLLPTDSNGSDGKTVSTTREVVEGKNDDLAEIRTLLMGLKTALSKASTVVTYDNPMVGEPIKAISNLSVSGDVLTYSGQYEQIDTIDASKLLKTVAIEEISGSAEEILLGCSDFLVWDKIATGLFSEVPNLSAEDITEFLIYQGTEKTMTAQIPAAKTASVFGNDFADLENAEISISYKETKIVSMTLTYSIGTTTITCQTEYVYR